MSGPRVALDRWLAVWRVLNRLRFAGEGPAFQITRFYYNTSNRVWLIYDETADDDGNGNPINCVGVRCREYRYDGARQRYLVQSRYGYAGGHGYQSLPESCEPSTFPYLHVGARYYDPEIGRRRRFARRPVYTAWGSRTAAKYRRIRRTTAEERWGRVRSTPLARLP